MEVEKRFVFAGHAIGAAAQFTRLGEERNLDHVVPTVGMSVLAVTGGLSESRVSNFCFKVDKPTRRNLLSVRDIHTIARGVQRGSNYETDVQAEIRNVSVLDKFHVDLLQLHVNATRTDSGQGSSIRTKGLKIEGIQLGSVTARIQIDESPVSESGTKQELANFFARQNEDFRREFAWRFNTQPGSKSIADFHGKYIVSIVKKIELSGPDDQLKLMKVDGYTIIWDGFGKIILGEVLVRDFDKRVVLVRLKMGSDAEGQAALGDGHSNGVTMP